MQVQSLLVNVSQLPTSLCSGIVMTLWVHGCTNPIPGSKVGMLNPLTNQGMATPQHTTAELQFAQCLLDANFIMAGKIKQE